MSDYHCDYCCGESCCDHLFVGCPKCEKGLCQNYSDEPALCYDCAPKVPCSGGCGREVLSGQCLNCRSGKPGFEGALAGAMLQQNEALKAALNTESFGYNLLSTDKRLVWDGTGAEIIMPTKDKKP